MALDCQLSCVAACMMVVLVISAAIATLTSVIIAHQPPTPGTNCYRKCVEGEVKECHFNFDIQPYQTMSRACHGCPHNITDCSLPDCVAADGVTRRILVINRQMPGPQIQVCHGDTVVVNVKNLHLSEAITIHWHGQTMSGSTQGFTHHTPATDSTPHMDGTPFITQCPITPGTNFRYKFLASVPGTHFYHAHSGFHRGDGVFGALVVRQPSSQDPNQGTFDYDLPQHTIMLHDWLHIPSIDKFLLRHHSGGDDFPESMLVNGKGPYQFAVPGSSESLMPYATFKVTPGNSYRLRLISNAILNCPIVLSVEDHQLTVIASDGHPLVPVNASSLVVYAGERWDVVIQADLHKAGGLYWMSFMGGVDCEVTEAHQFALLEYEDMSIRDSSGSSTGHGGHRSGTREGGTGTTTLASSDSGQRQNYHHHQQQQQQLHTQLHNQQYQQKILEKPQYTMVPPHGVQINSINSDCYEARVCVSALRSPHPMPEEARSPNATMTLYLAFEMNRINNIHYYFRSHYNFDLMTEEQQIPTPQINNLSFLNPRTPLLLGGGARVPVCSAEDPPSGRSCHDNHCECLHMYQVPLSATVDMVFVDEGQHGDENHPIHMHGHYFWVLGQGRPSDVPGASITRSEVMEMDARGEISRNLVNPPFKDTVTIPDGGYTVVRFYTNNPGYWLLHCHLLFHSAAGMQLVIKVGEDHDMPPLPSDFPTCGDY